MNNQNISNTDTESLIHQRDQLRAILLAIPDIVFIMNREGVFLDVYIKDQSILKLPKEKVVGSNLKDIFSQEEVERHLSAYQECLDKQSLKIIEYSMNIDGKEMYFEARLSPINKEKLLSIVRDITEKKQTQEILFKREERFRLLVKNSFDILLEMTAEGTLKYVNEAVEKITGFKPTEIVGKTFQELIHADDLPAVMEVFNEALAYPDQVHKVQYRHIHKTDGWVYLEALGQSFLKEPYVNAIVASIRDISEQKENEKKINQQLEELRRWYEATVGRESRILELKKEVNNLLIELDREPRYKSVLGGKSNE